MINEVGYDYEPYQGSHEDEFFDWYITMHGIISEGASQDEAISHLKVLKAPEWVITRIQNGEIQKGV